MKKTILVAITHSSGSHDKLTDTYHVETDNHVIALTKAIEELKDHVSCHRLSIDHVDIKTIRSTKI